MGSIRFESVLSPFLPPSLAPSEASRVEFAWWFSLSVCLVVVNRKFPTNCCFWPVITVRAYIAIKATAVKYALICASTASTAIKG